MHLCIRVMELSVAIASPNKAPKPLHSLHTASNIWERIYQVFLLNHPRAPLKNLLSIETPASQYRKFRAVASCGETSQVTLINCEILPHLSFSDIVVLQ